VALSKADLLPELDVYGFRDLVISKAADDLAELRKVLEGMVDSPDALAVGEDFVRLSSARFEPNRIEVTERIGLDLVLPMAAMLPFERHIRWADRKQIPAKVAAELLDGAGVMAVALIGKTKKLAPLMDLLESWGIGGKEVDAAMKTAAKISGEQLRKMNSDALAKRDHLVAVMTRFRLDLEDGEANRVLLRSKK
jgi:hypothetical protein